MDVHKDSISVGDLWLGERGEHVVTDFDGRLRACHVLGAVEQSVPRGRRRLLLTTVDPPFPTGTIQEPGDEVGMLVLSERYTDDDLEQLVDGWMSVNLYLVRDSGALLAGDASAAGLSLVAQGMVARSPSQLPPSQEEHFRHGLLLLQRFAERERHASVPLQHVEQGSFLGAFVNNLRSARAHGHLRGDWAEQLEAVPGWRWHDGDEVDLVAKFAAREGHTDIPIGHVEDGRPLGRWVDEVRNSHTRGATGRSALTRSGVWHRYQTGIGRSRRTMPGGLSP